MVKIYGVTQTVVVLTIKEMSYLLIVSGLFDDLVGPLPYLYL